MSGSVKDMLLKKEMRLVSARKVKADSSFQLPAGNTAILFAYNQDIIVEVADESYELLQGNVAVIKSVDISVTKKQEAASCFLLVFCGTALPGSKETDEPVSLINLSRDYELFSGLCREIVNITKAEETDEAELELRGYLVSATVLVLARNRRTVKKDHSNITEEVKQYIFENYHDEITLSTMANSVYVSTYYLAHTFKKDMGISPIQFLINYRMNKAKELLHETDMRIAEIAFKVGYENVNYFNLLFKKVNGISPGKYRKLFASPK